MPGVKLYRNQTRENQGSNLNGDLAGKTAFLQHFACNSNNLNYVLGRGGKTILRGSAGWSPGNLI
jgi:hypothetical protein